MDLNYIIIALNFLMVLLGMGFIFIPSILYKLILLILGLIVLIFNIALIKKNKREKITDKERNDIISLNQQKQYLILNKGIPERYASELGKDPVFKKYIDDGEKDEKNGKYKEAIKKYSEVFELVFLNATKKVVVYNLIGSCYYQQGEYGQAAENFTHAENNLREIRDKKEKQKAQTTVFYNLGLVNKSLLNFSLARGYFIKALKINKKIGNKISEANVLQDLAVLSLFFKKPKKFFIYLKNSIQTFQKALEVYTKKDFPMDYATTQNNLGIAYQILGEVKDNETNCQFAIDAYLKALKVYTKKDFPMNYAMTQNNLGNAYGTLGEVKDNETNCQFAIDAYLKALKVYTKKDFPMNYAMTQNNLGNAYGTLGEVKDKETNCQLAIDACQKALEVRTKKDFPMDYAATQNNLGRAYRILGGVKDKETNCLLAIDAYLKTLEVYTKKDFPMNYAATQNNLGNAYWILGEVKDKETNCQLAIDACQKALEVRTKKDFPMDYATTQNNLGNAYWILGQVKDKAQNTQLTKKSYQEALQFFNQKDYPEAYIILSRNISKLEEM